jgi:hypothetical protein
VFSMRSMLRTLKRMTAAMYFSPESRVGSSVNERGSCQAERNEALNLRSSLATCEGVSNSGGAIAVIIVVRVE